MAESPDSKASKSLTFRLPNEIYSELEQFAIAKGLLKSDGAIKTTDALIAVIKQGLGLSHGVSQNVSISDVDIQAMIDNAIAPLLAKIDQLEDDYKDTIINAKHEMRSFVIKGLTSSIDKPYFGVEETSETSLELDIQPIDDAIAPDTEALPIEKALPDETLSDAIAETKTKPTYRFAPDGSIILRSLKGISQRTIKRYSDAQLHEIGLYREQIGISTKYWEIQEDRREGKPKEPKTIATDEPKENLADKRFTAMAATAYYRVTTGQPLKETTLIANSKKYGFKIKEKGSGLYALINP